MEEKGKFNEEVRTRTMQMAAEVRNVLANGNILTIDKPAVIQLIRASSSVAANYCAATRARSDAEYYAKMSIVVEECDETLFWLMSAEWEIWSVKCGVRDAECGAWSQEYFALHTPHSALAS